MLGLLILAAAGSSLKWLMIVTAAGCVPALLLVLGSLTRVLQALLVFTLSMSLDFYLGFSDRFAETRPGVPLTVTAILLCGLYGLSAINGGSPDEGRDRARMSATVPFAMLVAWAGFSLLSSSRASYVLEALPGYVTSFLLYLYSRRLMRSNAQIRFTLAWIALAVLCGGVIGLVQYVTGGFPSFTVLGGSATQISQSYQSVQLSRVSGLLLRHPNTFALFLNGFLPVLLVLTFTRQARGMRLLAAAAFAAGLLALVLTFSRGGWLSFAVSVALVVAAAPKTEWRLGLPSLLVAVTTLSVLLVVLLTTPLYSRIMTRVADDDQGAAQSRQPLLKMSLRLIGAHPVAGVGLGNYQLASPIVTDDRGVALIEAADGLPMRVHNLVLFTAVELGVPGAVLLVTTIALFFWRGFAALGRRCTSLHSSVALGFTCGLVAILTHSMLEPATLADPGYLILPFVGGCLTGLGGAAERSLDITAASSEPMMRR